MCDRYQSLCLEINIVYGLLLASTPNKKAGGSLGDHWGITGNFEGGKAHLATGASLGDHWGITAGSLVTLRVGNLRAGKLTWPLRDHRGTTGGSLVTLRVGSLRPGKLTWPLGDHGGITEGSLGDRWGN